MNTLYGKTTSNDQGLIIDETTGETVAVTYKAENAEYIVNACNKYEDQTVRIERLESALNDLLFSTAKVDAPTANAARLQAKKILNRR